MESFGEIFFSLERQRLFSCERNRFGSEGEKLINCEIGTRIMRRQFLLAGLCQAYKVVKSFIANFPFLHLPTGRVTCSSNGCDDVTFSLSSLSPRARA